MKTRAPESSAADPCAQTSKNGPERGVAFKIAVFSLSVAGGYFITHLVFIALHQLPFWANAAHQKVSPASDALHTLHSGFGD
jgi:hypothetical protein